MLRNCLAGLLSLSLMSTTWAQEGRLEQIREAVRTAPVDVPEPPSPPEPPCRKESNTDSLMSGEDSFALVMVGGTLTVMGVTSPFWGPYGLLNDNLSHAHEFPPYPYVGEHANLFLANRPHPETPAHEWSLRASVEESNDFDGLNRVQGSLFLATSSRWGVTGNFTYLTERQGCGCYDEMWMGDVNGVFCFARNDATQFWAGLGARFLHDRQGTEMGFNATYGVDWAPVQPFVFTAQGDVGMLGHAWVGHGRLTAGAIWDRYELYGGYDWLRIGSVDLHGPVLGLRIWF
jgi:hypothetical protein